MARGIVCPHCFTPKAHVVDSMPSGDFIRLRRRCPECQQRFTKLIDMHHFLVHGAEARGDLDTLLCVHSVLPPEFMA